MSAGTSANNTQFWPREEDGVGATFPHHSLTCDVIGNSQMIIMGGSFPNMSTECDVPVIYGQHGLDLGKANVEGAKWAVFNPNVTQYKIPSEIAQTIGGGATGGATVLAPTKGWEERDLNVQFQRAYTPTTRTSTRYIPTSTATSPTTPSLTTPGDPNKKTIIAGAVGGCVGGLLLVIAMGAVCFWIRRRNRVKKDKTRGRQELPSQSTATMTPHPISMQQGSFLDPSTTQYTQTLQGSPSPPLNPPWSQYLPENPHTSALSEPFESSSPALGQHHSPNSATFKHSAQSSPVRYYEQSPYALTTTLQEMPNVRSPPLQEMSESRSPVSFSNQPQQEGQSTLGIDPYFAQHPPRGAKGDIASNAR